MTGLAASRIRIRWLRTAQPGASPRRGTLKRLETLWMHLPQGWLRNVGVCVTRRDRRLPGEAHIPAVMQASLGVLQLRQCRA